MINVAIYEIDGIWNEIISQSTDSINRYDYSSRMWQKIAGAWHSSPSCRVDVLLKEYHSGPAEETELFNS